MPMTDVLGYETETLRAPLEALSKHTIPVLSLHTTYYAICEERKRIIDLERLVE